MIDFFLEGHNYLYTTLLHCFLLYMILSDHLNSMLIPPFMVIIFSVCNKWDYGYIFFFY